MKVTHPRCGKSWTGRRMEHCPACCETFSTTSVGDRHRVGPWTARRCLTPDEMRAHGLHQDSRGVWRGAPRPTEEVPQ